LVIDAVCYLNQQGGLPIDEIDDIIIKTNEHAFKSYNKTVPHSIQDAQFSIPYVTAVALMKGNVTLEDYSEDAIRKPEVLTLSKKVKLSDEFKKYYPKDPVEVSVKTKDGKEYVKRVDLRKKGTLIETEEKFRSLTIPMLGKEKTDELLKVIERLEKYEEISSLTDLLTLNSKKFGE
jgi:2-methylcitrate dehydratase PrpD